MKGYVQITETKEAIEARAKATEARKAELAAEEARRVIREAKAAEARAKRASAREQYALATKDREAKAAEAAAAKLEERNARTKAQLKAAKAEERKTARAPLWYESGRKETIEKISSTYDLDGITDGAHVADKINKLLVEASYDSETTFQGELGGLGLTLAYDSATDEDNKAEYAASGFRGQIYKDKKGNLYSVIRGTDLAGAALSNATTDGSIAIGGSFNTTYKNALHKFASKLDEMSVADGSPTKPTVSVHGHSLGGGAANYIGALLAVSNPPKEGVTRQVRVIASDPVAVPTDVNRLIAAKKEFAESGKTTPSLQELTTAISLPDIEAHVVKHLGGESGLQSTARERFYSVDLKEGGARIFNLPFAVSYKTGTRDEYLQFSPVSLVNEHFGEVVVLISDTPPKATSTLHLAENRFVDQAVEALTRGALHGALVVHSPEILGSFSRAVFLSDDGNPALVRSIPKCMFGNNQLRPRDIGLIAQPRAVIGYDTKDGAVVDFSQEAVAPHVAIEIGDAARVVSSREEVKAVVESGRVGMAASLTTSSTQAPAPLPKPHSRSRDL